LSGSQKQASGFAGGAMTSYMNKDAPKTVIFIANRTYAIVSSRLNIVHKFLELGWDVVVVAKKDEFSHKLNSIGVDVVDFSFVRGSLSFSDLYSILRFPFVLFKLKPNLIHNFHAKPVILSTLLSRLLFRDNVTIINTITGLGYAFSKNGLLRMMSIFGYRLSLHRSNAVVFQNHDDKMLLNDLGLAVDNGYMIVSSGVDLSRFNYHSINPSLKVVMLGRLLWKKGVRDFVQVAEYFKNNNYDIEFCWGGELEFDHFDAVTNDWIQRHDNFNYIGFVHDVPSLLDSCSIFLCPSTYREGVPRVLLEAQASSLPIVAFNVPGVREVVEDGLTGFLVPPNDCNSMISAIKTLIEDRDLRLKMGMNARLNVEKKFDIKLIESQYFDLYSQFIDLD